MSSARNSKDPPAPSSSGRRGGMLERSIQFLVRGDKGPKRRHEDELALDRFLDGRGTSCRLFLELRPNPEVFRAPDQRANEDRHPKPRANSDRQQDAAAPLRTGPGNRSVASLWRLL